MTEANEARNHTKEIDLLTSGRKTAKMAKRRKRKRTRRTSMKSIRAKRSRKRRATREAEAKGGLIAETRRKNIIDSSHDYSLTYHPDMI